jgi:hypothetical protein
LRLDIMPHPLPCYPYRFNVRLSKWNSYPPARYQVRR